MNTTDIGKALNLAGSGVELEQAIIRFPPTVEVAGLLILQLVFNPVVLELLDSVGDPIRIFGNAFRVGLFCVILHGIPKFIPRHLSHHPSG